MNFMFSWQEQYFTSERSERARYCSCQSNIKFISSRHRVISSMYLTPCSHRLCWQNRWWRCLWRSWYRWYSSCWHVSSLAWWLAGLVHITFKSPGRIFGWYERCPGWNNKFELLSIHNVYLTNKEASTTLCSVVKQRDAGSGRARKKCRGTHETKSSVFPHFLSALPLPKCFTTAQSTVEASLFVLW